eukprot:4134827-Pyramimonas_sp.AAC.1
MFPFCCPSCERWNPGVRALVASGGGKIRFSFRAPLWATLGAVSEPFWAVLRASWAILGPSWVPLGPSWGPLGGLLGCLGASEARKGEHAEIFQNQ